MKTLKFNVPRCQALIVPAHSKNWPLLNKGCVFQLKRCQQRDYIFSFESRWTKAQKNCLYCTKTHRKPKRKLAVSQTPAQWPNPGWCLLYSWNRAHFCFILLGQCTWCESCHPGKANALPRCNPASKASQQQPSEGATRNSLIGKHRIIYSNSGFTLAEINFKPWSVNFYGVPKFNLLVLNIITPRALLACRCVHSISGQHSRAEPFTYLLN